MLLTPGAWSKPDERRGRGSSAVVAALAGHRARIRLREYPLCPPARGGSPARGASQPRLRSAGALGAGTWKRSEPRGRGPSGGSQGQRAEARRSGRRASRGRRPRQQPDLGVGLLGNRGIDPALGSPLIAAGPEAPAHRRFIMANRFRGFLGIAAAVMLVAFVAGCTTTQTPG